MVPACPAWTIRDAIARVTGIAADLGAGRMPGPDTQSWIDGHVAARQGRGLDELVDEWLASGVEAFIVQSGSGQLILDGCLHEHDICHALACRRAWPFELLRVFAGRRSERQMRALPWQHLDGTAADVEPWLGYLSHFPYPVAD